MTAFQTSPAGRTMIEGFEGKKNRAYRDIRGIWTCGIGCTGPDVGPDTYWDDAEVDRRFADRLANEFEPGVNRYLGDSPTTQGQFDALVSLAFNIGVEGFHRSHVLFFHLQGQYDHAADAFEMWDVVAGQHNDALHERRVKEGQLYLDSAPSEAA